MKACIIGGHVSPALAVIDALAKNHEVIWVGRKYSFEGDKTESLEYKTITERSIPFYHLQTGRVQRQLSLQTVPSLLKVPKGFFQALHILQKEKPDIVAGFGGYLSVPVCIAAYLLRIPVVIHEQTLEAGLANKVVGKFASKVCISFKTSQPFFPPHICILTGNPLRKEIVAARNEKQKTGILPTVFVTGGSTGSKAINMLIAEVLPQLLQKACVVHQTGAANDGEDAKHIAQIISSLPANEKSRYTTQHFMTPREMARYLASSDVVVSRSGMNTTTELLYLETPCLLIPLPYGQKNEQLQNARYLKSMGLAEIVDQDSIMKEEFLEKIMEMLEKKDSYHVNDSQAATIHEQAAKHICDVIEDVYSKKKTTA